MRNSERGVSDQAFEKEIGGCGGDNGDESSIGNRNSLFSRVSLLRVSATPREFFPAELLNGLKRILISTLAPAAFQCGRKVPTA
jgi:hypothetical protein